MNGPGPLLVDRWPSVRGSLAMPAPTAVLPAPPGMQWPPPPKFRSGPGERGVDAQMASGGTTISAPISLTRRGAGGGTLSAAGTARSGVAVADMAATAICVVIVAIDAGASTAEEGATRTCKFRE
jgi:hypothetical protein